MLKIHDILASHPVLAELGAENIALLAGCAHNETFKPGEMIFREGDEAQTFHVIRRGSVSLEIHAPGRGALCIQTLGENAVLGWSWLFPPRRWHFDARALDGVGLITMDARCIRAKCEADHTLGYRLMQQLAQMMTERLQATRLQLLDLYANPGEVQR
jgi:CRP-like cAMP-binding protein